MKLLTIFMQILFISLFFFLGAGIKEIISIPLPASIIGLAFLLLALFTGVVKLKWIEKGGNLLLAELLLFFIPSAVGIVNYNEIMSWQGLELVLIIAVSTFIVMAATAFTADFIQKKQSSVVK
ncbi:CidA/LrgA family protein [Metabacillus halosaccharovorans]|uniref:CidA/LrgA family protein n=1 Tax=Metabacillus halosaccharovorans TaxID=930124 RepID=UPI001C1F6626|nr:CidA/LrgA family protein [Metabacillus halosaccharovorans]MBU7595170.1 CidA/LrgA family protein [Metabacillus halosaccharovorans]